MMKGGNNVLTKQELQWEIIRRRGKTSFLLRYGLLRIALLLTASVTVMIIMVNGLGKNSLLLIGLVLVAAITAGLVLANAQWSRMERQFRTTVRDTTGDEKN